MSRINLPNSLAVNDSIDYMAEVGMSIKAGQEIDGDNGADDHENDIVTRQIEKDWGTDGRK